VATPDPSRNTSIERRSASDVVYVTSAALVAANQAVDLAGKLKARRHRRHDPARAPRLTRTKG
jgi:hypothetical protein